MPVSLGDWRVRIGTYLQWQRKEYDYNYFLRKLSNLIKRINKTKPSEDDNDECNISSSHKSSNDDGNKVSSAVSSCNIKGSSCGLNSPRGPPTVVKSPSSKTTSKTWSHGDINSPGCDSVTEIGSPCDFKGPGEGASLQCSSAKNSGSAVVYKNSRVPEPSELQKSATQPCAEGDEKDHDQCFMSPASSRTTAGCSSFSVLELKNDDMDYLILDDDDELDCREIKVIPLTHSAQLRNSNIPPAGLLQSGNTSTDDSTTVAEQASGCAIGKDTYQTPYSDGLDGRINRQETQPCAEGDEKDHDQCFTPPASSRTTAGCSSFSVLEFKNDDMDYPILDDDDELDCREIKVSPLTHSAQLRNSNIPPAGLLQSGNTSTDDSTTVAEQASGSAIGKDTYQTPYSDGLDGRINRQETQPCAEGDEKDHDQCFTPPTSSRTTAGCSSFSVLELKNDDMDYLILDDDNELDCREIKVIPLTHSAQLRNSNIPPAGLLQSGNTSTDDSTTVAEQASGSAIGKDTYQTPYSDGLDGRINRQETILSKGQLECQWLTSPVTGAGKMLCDDEVDKVEDKDHPDVNIILLLRSGDIEQNPGPSEMILTELELYLLADGMDATDFRKVGLALHFTEAQLSRFERDQGNIMQATYQMLCAWRKGVCEAEARDDLVNTLQDIKLVNLADILRRGQVGKNIPSLTEEEVRRVAEDVKDYMRNELCQIQADPLNSELLLQFERIFTNLTLMEEDKGTRLKMKLLYEDLLKIKVNGAYPKRLLVEGEGGVGKTTLCSKIAWDWIHGKGYTDFKLVLVILLRMAKDKTIGEIVKSYLHDDNPVTAKQLDKYILTNQKDVFLVLDGLDELAMDFTSIQQIVQIILNRLFMSGTVLITSRQWRSDEIRKKADLRKVFAFIAVEGFSTENLASYITKFFHPDTVSSEELIGFITDNDVIRENMAPFPIYAAMLCIMWKEFDGERREAMCKLQTFSQLFDQMINFLVDHYLAKDVGSWSEQRSTVLHHLTLIGWIAFQGLRTRRLVFSEAEFQNCSESLNMGCKVGVLTREHRIPSMRDRRKNPDLASSTVQFPHKLFQEYLSGMYIASLYSSDSRSEYKQSTDEILQHPWEYRNLLYFISAQGKEIGVDIMSHLLPHMNNCNFIVDVAYESQDQEVAKAVADHLTATRTDMTLEIYSNLAVHTVSAHIFVVHHRIVDKLVISKSCGRTTSEDLAEFMCSSPSLKHVKILSMARMHDVFYSILANKTLHSKIETLKIWGVNLSKHPSASHDLAQFICKMPHLKRLDLKGHYHDDFYSTSSSLATCTKIETLKIWDLNLSKHPPASHDLAQFICKMPHLKSLHLRGQYHDDFYSTSSSLATCTKIETLHIWIWNVTERLSRSHDLAQFICKMPHLKSLDLIGQYHDDFYSTSSSLATCTKDDNLSGHTSPTLTELTLNDTALGGWLDCGPMFDMVEKFILQLRAEISPDIIQRIHLPQAVELTIQRHEKALYAGYFDEKPTTLTNAILNAFPQLIKVTFRDLHLGNDDIKSISEAFRSTRDLKHLKTIMFIRCRTDENVDDFIHEFNEDQLTKVEIEHGRPFGEDDESDSYESDSDESESDSD